MVIELDTIDRDLLDIIQSNFPLDPQPYAVLGKKLNISEAEAYERVLRMKKQGIIRRIGANFQSSKLGFVSTLCAAKVPPEAFNSVIDRLNSEPGITHNYERDHEYNIWFTLISPSREEEAKILDSIRKDTGITIFNLPAAKLFKIKVDFPMNS